MQTSIAQIHSNHRTANSTELIACVYCFTTWFAANKPTLKNVIATYSYLSKTLPQELIMFVPYNPLTHAPISLNTGKKHNFPLTKHTNTLYCAGN